MDKNRTSIVHFEALLRILRDLEPHKIELYEHQYHPEAFGSFVAVLGRAHERAKFSWDGRESLLSISLGSFPNKNAPAAWAHDADISLPNGHGLYEEIASNAAQMLAI